MRIDAGRELSAGGERAFLSHVLRNFIEDASPSGVFNPKQTFLSHVLRNFIEDANQMTGNQVNVQFLSHVLRNFIEDAKSYSSPLSRL